MPRHLIRNSLLKGFIRFSLHGRLLLLSRNASKLIGKLSKTKRNMKDGTPSNHLEKAISRDFRVLSAIR
jgi:hypothetical protein